MCFDVKTFTILPLWQLSVQVEVYFNFFWRQRKPNINLKNVYFLRGQTHEVTNHLYITRGVVSVSSTSLLRSCYLGHKYSKIKAAPQIKISILQLIKHKTMEYPSNYLIDQTAIVFFVFFVKVFWWKTFGAQNCYFRKFNSRHNDNREKIRILT